MQRWCLWDKVKLDEKTGFISGFTGKMVYLQNYDGQYLQVSSKYKQISVDKLSLIERNNNWICQEVAL